METILRQFKQIIITVMLMLFVAIAANAQVKHPVSRELKKFARLASQANVEFVFPDDFKEVKAPDNEYFSFDYGIALPGKEMEIWFEVKSGKENWQSYLRAQNSQKVQLDNPDSVYTAIGAANASAFTGNNYFMRVVPPQVLARYNADEGKSYMLNLLDMPETRHYKYAMLITLQKNHIGTIVAICFTNEKGPEFFKNFSKTKNCIHFKS